MPDDPDEILVQGNVHSAPDPLPCGTQDNPEQVTPPDGPPLHGGRDNVRNSVHSSTRAQEQESKSNRSSRTSRKGKSRSNSKVSMERNVQTQAEADEAAQIISSSSPSGAMLLSLIRELHKQPGRAQRLINLEIPVLVRSLKSSNVELG